MTLPGAMTQNTPLPKGVDGGRSGTWLLREEDDLNDDDLKAYEMGLAESIPANAPESDFADPPKGLYVGDAKHVQFAIQAVTKGFRGNKAKSRGKPGVKARIAKAIHKFYQGDDAKYYSQWLSSGKKPEKKPAAEMMSLESPIYGVEDAKNFPDVPIFPDIDVQKLTAGDTDPLFVVRPLGVLGAVSNNGLVYDERLLQLIEQQVTAKRPGARLGHVPEENRDWQVPPDQGLWVGVLRENGTLYGKCYILPNTDLHQMAEKRAAAGAPLSNSMWGKMAVVQGNDGNAHVIDLNMETIDFVPVERAALGALGGMFDTTSEMEGDTDDMAEEHSDAAADLALFKKAIANIKPEDVHESLSELQRRHVAEATVNSMDPMAVYEMMKPEHRQSCAETHLKEAAPEEVYKKLSEAHRKGVAECYAKEMGLSMAKPMPTVETTTDTDVAEMTSLKSRLAEMEAVVRRYEQDEFDRALDKAVDARLDWRISTLEGQSKLSALKKNFRVQLVAEMAGSQKKDDIEPAASRAWENFRPLAEITRTALAGPNAFVNGQQQTPHDYDAQSKRYDDKTAKQAAEKLNLI